MKHANIVILIKSVFNYHNYHETIWEKYSNKQYIKCYIMIELMFLNVIMLIKQARKSVLFVVFII